MLSRQEWSTLGTMEAWIVAGVTSLLLGGYCSGPTIQCLYSVALYAFGSFLYIGVPAALLIIAVIVAWRPMMLQLSFRERMLILGGIVVCGFALGVALLRGSAI